MKPNSHVASRERNNCHLDKRFSRDDKQAVSVPRTRTGTARWKDFYDFLKDRAG
jgi:hypothetical protein